MVESKVSLGLASLKYIGQVLSFQFVQCGVCAQPRLVGRTCATFREAASFWPPKHCRRTAKADKIETKYFQTGLDKFLAPYERCHGRIEA